jgi:hypothetical protein
LMCVSKAQVCYAGGISATEGALLEVSFKNIGSREGVLAEGALIRPIPGVSQEMPFQMLCVKVGLRAMWAREFSVLVLYGCHISGRTRQYTRVVASLPRRFHRYSRCLAVLIHATFSTRRRRRRGSASTG